MHWTCSPLYAICDKIQCEKENNNFEEYCERRKEREKNEKPKIKLQLRKGRNCFVKNE